MPTKTETKQSRSCAACVHMNISRAFYPVKSHASYLAAMVSAAGFAILFHGEVTLADGCPRPSLAAAKSFDAGVNPYSVAVGDFKGDGRLDLVLPNDTSASLYVAVLLGNGDGTFQTPPGILRAGTGPISVAVGDFNGDGKPDLAVANRVSTDVSVLLGNGDGTFQSPYTYITGERPSSVAVGDFDRDGRPDLAVANEAFSGTVWVLVNTCVSAGPNLNLVSSNGTVSVSWPFPSTGFILESTMSLSLTNWQSVVEAPMTNNGRVEVSVPLSQIERYFRLRKP